MSYSQNKLNMRNFIVLLIIAHVLSLESCARNNANGKAINSIANSKQNTFFKPDTSLNNKLFLNDPASTVRAFGNITPLLNHDSAFPDVYFLGSSGEQYLRMIILPGSTINSVSQFEVGYSSSLSNKNNKRPSNFPSFVTENKTRLGITKDELVTIKGDKYTEIKKDNAIIVRYVLNDFDNSSFLRRYNMPVYFAEYWIQENKLIRYRFGFEYP